MHSANILVFEGSEQAAVAAGDAFIASARTSGTRPVGLATGQTMTPVYDHLLTIDGQANGLFADTVFSQLDEVIGQTSPTDSFAAEITTSLFSQFRATPAGFLMIDGQAGAPAGEAIRHCSAIRMAGGLAMQLLGIGVNGHVGFNEPGSPDSSRCRVVDLAASTIQRNGYDTGMQGITLGIADILAAEQIILVATGAAKAAAISAMINGPKTPDCPASLLRDHPDIRLFLDKEAAGQIS